MTKHTIPMEEPFSAEPAPEEKQPRFPTIAFPASESQISELEVGDAVKVTFDGTIESMVLSDSKRPFDRTEIRLAINETDIVPAENKKELTGVEEMGATDPTKIFG